MKGPVADALTYEHTCSDEGSASSIDGSQPQGSLYGCFASLPSPEEGCHEMEDVGSSCGASDLPIDVRVVGIFADLLESCSFYVRLLVDNLYVDYHSNISHGGYNDRLTGSLHRSSTWLLVSCSRNPARKSLLLCFPLTILTRRQRSYPHLVAGHIVSSCEEASLPSIDIGW